MGESGRRIGIYHGNRYYWALGGAPVLLLGGAPRAEGPNDVGVFHLPTLRAGRSTCVLEAVGSLDIACTFSRLS